MIPQELLKSVEDARLLLRKGLYKTYEGLAFRCMIFYADIALAKAQGRLLKSDPIICLSEVFKSSASMLIAYQTASEAFKNKEDEASRGFRMLLMFGLVQCFTQIIETTDHLCKSFSVSNNEMKQKEYWAFRNRLNHVLLDIRRPSTKGLDKALPLNQFAILPGSHNVVSFRSSGDTGYAVRHASMSNIAAELHVDLMILFKKILSAALMGECVSV